MKNLKIFLTLLISGISATSIIMLACGGGDWDGTEGSMFAPEVIEKQSNEPFFRASYSPFYGTGSYYENYNKAFNESNVAEWNTYFEKQVSNEKLNFWLYKANLKDVDAMIFKIKGKKELKDSLLPFSLADVKPSTKTNSFLYYLGFAKRNEEFAVRNIYNWYGEEEKKEPTIEITGQIEGGQKFLSNAKDDFMKERYLFQLIRLNYFSANYENTIKLYNDNKSTFKTGNSIQWRCMGYAAAAHNKQKNYSQANYFYSLIYAGCEQQKQSAYLSFHPQDDKDWNACLALAKNTKEKTVLWQLFGLYFDPHKAIDEIYKLDPKSEQLDLLLVRLVNMEEEKFNGNVYEKAKREEYKCNKETISIINKIASANNTSNPSLWNLAAAYINYASRDFKVGAAYLAQAEKGKDKSELFNAQYHIIKLFGNLYAAGEINEKTEKLLLPDIKILFDTKTMNIKSARTLFAQNWTRSTLSYLYAQKGEYEKAEMIYAGSVKNYFSDIPNIRAMISYFEKPKHSELEEFFIPIASTGKINYLELLGIRYAQVDKLDSAIIAFKQVKSPETLLGNPFTIHINDCHDCDHAAAQKTKYTRLSFAEKMFEMKNKAASKPEEAAQNYFLVANGFYNMTYFGNARLFYDNPIDFRHYYYSNSNEGTKENDCALALKYYLLARDKSTDKEFKAKCTFMAAKCEQNLWFLTRKYEDGIDFKSGVYFKELVKTYSTTKYFDEIVKECGYFRTFATN
jgi:hypothetical protein